MPASSFHIGDQRVNRIGFGAMQLPGKGVMGPADDRERAVQVVRDAVAGGVDHIDTASFYGPDVANELICEALHPYADDLCIVSKVGARRDEQGGWHAALGPEEIEAAIEGDLRVLQRDALTMVNLRVTKDTDDDVFSEALDTVVRLRAQGMVEHVGLSNVTVDQLESATSRHEIAGVQNRYGLLDRGGEDVLRVCTQRGLAFTPFFPLGSAVGAAPRPSDDETVQRVAAEHERSPVQIALAWLLAHAENILLIPGTGSPDHLAENIAVGEIELSEQDLVTLDGLAPPPSDG